MGESALVERVVQFAFVIRLASLLLVTIQPTNDRDQSGVMLAVAFITLTSSAGLLATPYFMARVAAHPFVLVLDVLAATGIAALVGSESPIILYSISTAVLVGILLTRVVAVLVLSILVGCYVLVTLAQHTDPTALSLLLVPVTYGTVGALGILTRRLHESAMHQQREARRFSEDAARDRERARLARDMHDSVAKSLHGIGLAAAALPTWAAQRPEMLPQKARELQQAAETAAAEARAILVELRAETDDRTLAQQLRVMSDDLSRGGLQSIFTVGGIGDCDHAVKRELVAIVSEAVENVRRHSGAGHVAITCSANPETITIAVRDDGRGFDPSDRPDGHFGLVGMHERAETIGADLTVTSSPGAGTTVVVASPRSLDPRGNPS